MPQIRIYLAGPEVFLPDAVEIGRRKKMLCREFGFVGLFPLDNEFAAGADRIDEKIFAANVALMREAEVGIFNLTPFRGVNADPGTAFELGFFTAMGKPVFAYTNSAKIYFDRVAEKFGSHRTPDGAFRDADDLLIENFGNAENLMLDGALKAQRRGVLRPEVGTLDPDDLTHFVACLREARLHFET